MASLEHLAGIHRKEYGLHRLLVHRFPYAIYYNITDETAQVVAILDVRQHPNKHYQRLLAR